MYTCYYYTYLILKEKIIYRVIILMINEVPGVNEFVAQNSPQTEPSAWAAGLTPDDINQLHRKFLFDNKITWNIFYYVKNKNFYLIRIRKFVNGWFNIRSKKIT